MENEREEAWEVGKKREGGITEMWRERVGRSLKVLINFPHIPIWVLRETGKVHGKCHSVGEKKRKQEETAKKRKTDQ